MSTSFQPYCLHVEGWKATSKFSKINILVENFQTNVFEPNVVAQFFASFFH
jgi:hypothetical protein